MNHPSKFQLDVLLIWLFCLTAAVVCDVVIMAAVSAIIQGVRNLFMR